MDQFNRSPELFIEELTQRETEILELLSGDMSNQEIADTLFLALSTVKGYLRQIYQKLGVNNRRKAVTRAIQLGLLGNGTFLSKSTHNLPVQLTSFIGREREITQVIGLLNQNRLVTLTGTGGTGKSRLAYQVATKKIDLFPNGVWLVALASLSDPTMVPKAVAIALNLPEMPEKPDLDILVNFLKTKHLMLILDNCEHLLEACVDLVDRLLHNCTEIHILTTSREFLGVEGEAIYRVPPMTLPSNLHSRYQDELLDCDAVQLFVARAQNVSPNFIITKNNADVVAEVVNRLDGIPLAIELAAARMNVLGIEQIAQRLNDTFRLLTSGDRTKLPHHKTLRASMDWSHELLSESERFLLRRLSVFVGGWRLRAAEKVCTEGIDIQNHIAPETVLDLLTGLVEKSLVIAVEETDGRKRYHMLKTIRQYADEKLLLSGEEVIVKSQMLRYYLDLVISLEPKLRGREQVETLRRLEIELNNLRTVLEWALKKDIISALTLASSLQWFWHIHFHWSEGINWLNQALEAESNLQEDPEKTYTQKLIRARALLVLGFHLLMQYLQNTPTLEQATDALEESLRIYQRSDLEQNREAQNGQAWSLLWLSNCMFKGGDPQKALAMAKEAVNLFRQINEPHGIAESLQLIGDLEVDPEQRKEIYQEQLSIEETTGDVDGIANALYHSGDAASNDGDFESAYKAFESSRGYYRQVNDPIMVAMSWLAMGIASFSKGDLLRANQGLQESLKIFRQLGFENRLPFSLFFLCLLRIAEGKYEEAVEANENAWKIFRNTGIRPIAADVLYARARLARLRGEFNQAKKYAEEVVNYAGHDHPQGMLSYLELGHLALQAGDLQVASSYFRKGIQLLLYKRETGWVFAFMEGLAFFNARSKLYERAARLCGTRWCLSYSHFLSPIELAMRNECIEDMKLILGKGHYTRLSKEGFMMSFKQAMDYALDL